LPPSASFIKIDTPGLGAATGLGVSATKVKVGAWVPAVGTMEGALLCAFDTAEGEKDGTVTEVGTIEGSTVGASNGVGIGATRHLKKNAQRPVYNY
jgi:hypothetical protein